MQIETREIAPTIELYRVILNTFEFDIDYANRYAIEKHRSNDISILAQNIYDELVAEYQDSTNMFAFNEITDSSGKGIGYYVLETEQDVDSIVLKSFGINIRNRDNGATAKAWLSELEKFVYLSQYSTILIPIMKENKRAIRFMEKMKYKEVHDSSGLNYTIYGKKIK